MILFGSLKCYFRPSSQYSVSARGQGKNYLFFLILTGREHLILSVHIDPPEDKSAPNIFSVFEQLIVEYPLHFRGYPPLTTFLKTLIFVAFCADQREHLHNTEIFCLRFYNSKTKNCERSLKDLKNLPVT